MRCSSLPLMCVSVSGSKKLKAACCKFSVTSLCLEGVVMCQYCREFLRKVVNSTRVLIHC